MILETCPSRPVNAQNMQFGRRLCMDKAARWSTILLAMISLMATWSPLRVITTFAIEMWTCLHLSRSVYFVPLYRSGQWVRCGRVALPSEPGWNWKFMLLLRMKNFRPEDLFQHTCPKYMSYQTFRFDGNSDNPWRGRQMHKHLGNVYIIQETGQLGI